MIRVISTAIGGLLILTGLTLGVVWQTCRVYVGPDEQAIITKKTGAPLAPGQTIANAGQKGIQHDTLGPGRHFINPVTTEVDFVPLLEVPAGDPATWRTVYESGKPDYSVPTLEGKWPMVGVVTSFAGKPSSGGEEVVDKGVQGLQREVLTPGVYRLNPRAYKVELSPAVVVPVGCVGVVISQIGEMPGVEVTRETIIGPDGQAIEGQPKTVQKLAEAGQRGVLRTVLGPGIYYLNPYVHKVKIVQVGYNQITQLRSEPTGSITFPAADGFTIEVEVTVVWGRHPEHVPEMINRLGDLDRVRDIILSQMRSICRNLGSDYQSTDFIRGEKRELYQQAVTERLQAVAAQKDIEILIALIHNIAVRASDTTESPDLKATIQQGYIAQERDLTMQAKQESAKVRATLETALAEIEVAREQIRAETRKKVAEIVADGHKLAAEIDAGREVEVAKIDRQIAELEAQKRLMLGEAEADVERMKNNAEAEGKALMVTAFGSGRAYNLYTFAENFDPESIRLFYAGEGTFWTDLNQLQDVAALELLRTRANDD